MSRVEKTLSLAMMATAVGCVSTPAPVGPYVVSSPQPNASRPYAAAPYFQSYPRRQCAPYAREMSGINIYGDAHTWWAQAAGVYPQSTYPSIGSVMVIRTWQDGSRGHVAVVRQIVSDRVILVDHANWQGREEVAVNVPVRDVSIRGDWSEVNVWWMDTNSWGAKSYNVDGFIHPR